MKATPVSFFVRRSVSMPSYRVFKGQTIVLKKLDLVKDIASLYKNTHGTRERESVWRYLPYGPFDSQENMALFYKGLMSVKNRLLFCAHNITNQHPVGVVALEDIHPEHFRAEIGGVLYFKEYQKSKVNTEAVYLLAKHCFKDLHYRRITWRCNDKNTASMKAAERLGFQPEGVFHQHMIVKEENRDTAWYALLDKHWPLIEPNYEKWLYANNGGKHSLAKMNKATLETAFTKEKAEIPTLCQ